MRFSVDQSGCDDVVAMAASYLLRILISKGELSLYLEFGSLHGKTTAAMTDVP